MQTAHGTQRTREELIDLKPGREQDAAGLLDLLGHQYITPAADLIEPLVDLYELKGSKDPCIFYIQLFNYGYIEGKRAERARRAKKAATL